MADAGYGMINILEWHERFANTANIVYGLATLGYLLQRFLYDGITTQL